MFIILIYVVTDASPKVCGQQKTRFVALPRQHLVLCQYQDWEASPQLKYQEDGRVPARGKTGKAKCLKTVGVWKNVNEKALQSTTVFDF